VSRVSGLSRWFPWPFVGVTLLLATLIFLTPVLIASVSPPAVGLLSQGELIVDGLSSNNSTLHFYVRGASTSARYTAISIGFAFDVNWSDPFGGAKLNWTNWTNASDALSVGQLVEPVPVAVNVSALYVADGVSALYLGMLAFNVSVPSPGATPLLTMVSNTTGITGFSSYSFGGLPITIALVNVGPGRIP
jgi:hypothetical protein